MISQIGPVIGTHVGPGLLGAGAIPSDASCNEVRAGAARTSINPASAAAGPRSSVILAMVGIGTIAFIALLAWLGVFVVVLGLCKASARGGRRGERIRTTSAGSAVRSEELVQLYRG